MGHGDHRPGKALQIIFQNGQGQNVQIVGGLVQQQNVGGFHQNAQQIESPPFAARQPPDGHRLPLGRKEETLHHLLGREGAFVGVGLFRDAVNEVIDPHIQIQLPAFLRKVAHLYSAAAKYFTAVGLQLSCNQLEQGGLAGTVFAHDADAVLPQQVVGEILQHDFVAVGLGDLLQLDDLLAQTAGRSPHADGFFLHRAVLIQ